MNQVSNKNQVNVLIKVVKNFLSRMIKCQEEYPVKYYKKDRDYNKNKQY
jgi:hypothetical protein